MTAHRSENDDAPRSTRESAPDPVVLPAPAALVARGLAPLGSLVLVGDTRRIAHWLLKAHPERALRTRCVDASAANRERLAHQRALWPALARSSVSSLRLAGATLRPRDLAGLLDSCGQTLARLELADGRLGVAGCALAWPALRELYLDRAAPVPGSLAAILLGAPSLELVHATELGAGTVQKIV